MWYTSTELILEKVFLYYCEQVIIVIINNLNNYNYNNKLKNNFNNNNNNNMKLIHTCIHESEK